MEAPAEILESINRTLDAVQQTQQRALAAAEASQVVLVVSVALAAFGFSVCVLMLSRQSRWLGECARYLAEHGRILAEHGRMLAEHGRAMAEHGRVMAEMRREVGSTESYAARIAASLENVSRLVIHAGGKKAPKDEDEDPGED